jgi:6-phosphogluconate dehydrogenase
VLRDSSRRPLRGRLPPKEWESRSLPGFFLPNCFYDGYRTAHLPANLLQAQRDYFGAHTRERLDTPRGKFFHTNWTGEGMDVASGQYYA